LGSSSVPILPEKEVAKPSEGAAIGVQPEMQVAKVMEGAALGVQREIKVAKPMEGAALGVQPEMKVAKVMERAALGVQREIKVAKPMEGAAVGVQPEIKVDKPTEGAALGVQPEMKVDKPSEEAALEVQPEKVVCEIQARTATAGSDLPSSASALEVVASAGIENSRSSSAEASLMIGSKDGDAGKKKTSKPPAKTRAQRKASVADEAVSDQTSVSQPADKRRRQVCVTDSTFSSIEGGTKSASVLSIICDRCRSLLSMGRLQLYTD
jgi:hypothetical protein